MNTQTTYLNGTAKVQTPPEYKITELFNPEFNEAPQEPPVVPTLPKSNSEAGVSNTIDNVEVLTDCLELLEPDYNPSNPLLPVANIEAIQTEAVARVNEVIQKENDNSNDIYHRHLLFNPLPDLATRLINQLESCGASADVVKKARLYDNKIHGNPTDKKKNSKQPVKKISNSQRSYVQLAQHLQNMITIAKDEPLFDPSIDDLKIVNLESTLAAMKLANKNCNKSAAALKMARLKRNDLFNRKGTGLVDICLLAKNEVKSIFGATSPEYYMISGLAFRRIETR